MVPVVFEVYTLAPCGFMLLHVALQLHVAPVVFAGTAAPVVFEVYKMAPCISMHL